LNLPTLKYRGLRGDMTEGFKITHNIRDKTVSSYLPFNIKANTRSNNYKLFNHSFYYDLHKHYFSARIVNTWNSLPNSVVNASTAWMDMFSSRQVVKYDFTAGLTGTGVETDHD